MLSNVFRGLPVFTPPVFSSGTGYPTTFTGIPEGPDDDYINPDVFVFQDGSTIKQLDTVTVTSKIKPKVKGSGVSALVLGLKGFQWLMVLAAMGIAFAYQYLTTPKFKRRNFFKF